MFPKTLWYFTQTDHVHDIKSIKLKKKKIMSLLPLRRYGTLQTGQVEPDFIDFEMHELKTIRKKY